MIQQLWQSPLFAAGLVLLTALTAGLLMLTVASRLEISTRGPAQRRLAAYQTDTADTPLEQVGAWAIKRFPTLRNLLGLEQHRRWLALVGQSWSLAATVGLAVLLGALGLGALFLSGIPALLAAPLLGFLLPFVRQRSAAEKVKRQVQNNLPDLSALLAAEMAAGNPPDRAVERAADLGGPLAAILQVGLTESRVTGRPLFSRGDVAGLLVEIARRYDLPALQAFTAQIDMAATTGAAGAELMNGLARSLIVEYKDRALREAEALDSRLAVPSVGFFFMPFLFLVLVPLLLPVLNAL